MRRALQEQDEGYCHPPGAVRPTSQRLKAVASISVSRHSSECAAYLIRQQVRGSPGAHAG